MSDLEWTYEDELGECSDEEYAVWYSLSALHFGVRVGPSLNTTRRFMQEMEKPSGQVFFKVGSRLVHLGCCDASQIEVKSD